MCFGHVLPNANTRQTLKRPAEWAKRKSRADSRKHFQASFHPNLHPTSLQGFACSLVDIVNLYLQGVVFAHSHPQLHMQHPITTSWQ
jgi:hypothetical protein